MLWVDVELLELVLDLVDAAGLFAFLWRFTWVLDWVEFVAVLDFAVELEGAVLLD